MINFYSVFFIILSILYFHVNMFFVERTNRLSQNLVFPPQLLQNPFIHFRNFLELWGQFQKSGCPALDPDFFSGNGHDRVQFVGPGAMRIIC